MPRSPRRRTVTIAAVTGVVAATGIGVTVAQALDTGAGDVLPAVEGRQAPSTTVDHITVATPATTSTTLAAAPASAPTAPTTPATVPSITVERDRARRQPDDDRSTPAGERRSGRWRRGGRPR